MRRFPTREADVAALARQIIAGLTENAEHFPVPPLPPAELQSFLETYERTHEAAVSARAAAAVAYREKDEALEELIYGMKAELRYAEHAVKHDDAKLKSLGWRKRRESAAPAAPGAARSLRAIREGPGWVCLDWRRPEDGGVVATYQVQLYHPNSREWQNVELCFDTLTVLTDQERAVELTYRVVTLNKAGEGLASNTVTVVL
jgi:hypothetical protein